MGKFARFLSLAVLFAWIIIKMGHGVKLRVSVKNKFLHRTHVDLLLKFDPVDDVILNDIKYSYYPDRVFRLEEVVSALQRAADASQEKVADFLHEQDYQFKSFWISNHILVKSATKTLVFDLLKFDGILSIDLVPTMSLSMQSFSQMNSELITQDDFVTPTWNVQKISAKEAKSLLDDTETTGISLDTIRVASIDTGVDADHEALRGNFAGSYGWLDPYDYSDFPTDLNGQGTFAMGVMAGSKGIGVYPDAVWMACRGCDVSSCDSVALLECAQFLLCPTEIDGSSTNCSYAPHVILNSWGWTGQEKRVSFFDDVLVAWDAANIISLFPSEADGDCSSKKIWYPANHPLAIAVGFPTSRTGRKYPLEVVVDGLEKTCADVNGPGINVISASTALDEWYVARNGSLAAAAHVAGLVAMIRAYGSDLERLGILEFLEIGVEVEILNRLEDGCGGEVEDLEEDVWEIINAYNSIAMLVET